MKILPAAVSAAALAVAAALVGQGRAGLVVHEWGTFTSLQDDAGNAIGGVNTEDEPLPAFVHRPLANLHLRDGDVAPILLKGAPPCHPDVTMRLETPVVYFYLPEGAAAMNVDVAVEWRGGWLSEFYPAGAAVLPGADIKPAGRLAADTVGTLRWSGVRIGERQTLPATESRVWLAPRNVSASDVRVGEEAERYLFYRGVGHVDAPLRVCRSADEKALVLSAQVDSALARRHAMSSGPLWLVDVDPLRGVAFRELPPLPLTGDANATLGEIAASFAEAEYAADNLDRLRASMRRALIADGLFAEEAEAMLETWKVSYFKSHGTRLFFLVPQEWTDHVMPLQLSAPAQVERVMVARIELVNERQRALLARIAAGPASDARWLGELTEKLVNDDPSAFPAAWSRLTSAPGVLAGAGAEVPDDYRAWLELGRFRHCLLLAECERRPTAPLRAFAANYLIER